MTHHTSRITISGLSVSLRQLDLRRLKVDWHSRTLGLLLLCFAAISCLPVFAASPAKQDKAYKTYVDPQRRFSFEYPATMSVKSPNPNEVRVLHPQASFRIAVFVEERSGKTPLSADQLLEALTKKLQEEKKDVSVLQHGKLPKLAGSQAYLVASFKEPNGMEFVQLVQYYVAPDRILQMTLSDRPQGFANLASVIKRVHSSLRILAPALR
ncbi:MAG: hypothetical protein HY914_06015 [Desulfomonile tiedjei]|nr:hypothetical protein [Desulfomonile tiedjei]